MTTWNKMKSAPKDDRIIVRDEFGELMDVVVWDEYEGAWVYGPEQRPIEYTATGWLPAPTVK